MSGSVMERGARRQGTPQSGVQSGAERFRCFLHIVDLEVDPPFAIYKCGMLILKEWCSPLYCCYDSSGDMTLSFSRCLCSHVFGCVTLNCAT